MTTAAEPSRRRLVETRGLILDTAVRMLLARGLEGGCDHVGLADVLREVHASTGRRITNASVYGRIWANQAAFHAELLQRAAEFYPDGEEHSTAAAADEVLAGADLTTADGRAAALREVCRRAGAAHLATLASSRAWQIWLAIWAVTVSTPSMDDDRERGPALARRHEHAVAEFASVLGDVADRLGYGSRPGLHLSQIATAIYALSEGLALHDRFAPADVALIELPTGPGGAPQPWTLFAVGVEALLGGMIEPR